MGCDSIRNDRAMQCNAVQCILCCTTYSRLRSSRCDSDFKACCSCRCRKVRHGSRHGVGTPHGSRRNFSKDLVQERCLGSSCFEKWPQSRSHVVSVAVVQPRRRFFFEIVRPSPFRTCITLLRDGLECWKLALTSIYVRRDSNSNSSTHTCLLSGCRSPSARTFSTTGMHA